MPRERAAPPNSLYRGSLLWIGRYIRALRHIPDEDDEPFRRGDLHPALQDDDIWQGLMSHSLIEKAGRVDEDNAEDGGDKTGTTEWKWRVTEEARDEIIYKRDTRRGSDSTNPLPCDCPIFSIHHHGDTIECKDCGETWDREDIDTSGETAPPAADVRSADD